MKSTYIYVLLILVIIGGVYYFTMSRPDSVEEPKTVVLPTNDDITVTPETGASDESQSEPSATPEEHTGDDMGMEFPTIENPSSETSLSGEDTAISIDENARVFNVSGENFAFNVKEMRVKEGETVVIHFTSIDGFHDWALDEFGAKTDKVGTGETSSVTFVAEKKGTFEYYCSVGNHRAKGMVGKLIVE